MKLDPQTVETIGGNSSLLIFMIVLGMARPLGILFSFLPFLWSAAASPIVRTGVAFAVALPVIFLEANVMIAFALKASWVDIFVMNIKEFIIGFLMGLIASTPFWIVQFGGTIVDAYRGEFSPNEPDLTGGVVPTFARYQLVVAFLVFASMGGFWFLFQSLYKSYEIWKITELLPAIQENAVGLLLNLINHLMVMALIIALPILALMMAIDFITLMMAKMVKGMNAPDVSFILKNLIALICLPIFTILLIQFLKDVAFKDMNLIRKLEMVIS